MIYTCGECGLRMCDPGDDPATAEVSDTPCFCDDCVRKIQDEPLTLDDAREFSPLAVTGGSA